MSHASDRGYIYDQREWARFDALDAGAAAAARGEDRNAAADRFHETSDKVARSAGYPDRFAAADAYAARDAAAAGAREEARAQGLLREADAEAARDRDERADPGLRALVEARDHNAAGGRFDVADSQQRLIDATVRRSAERAERREREDRETDAQLRHDGFPFWADRDRPEPGPTDRPGVIERTKAHQVQGQTRDRAHWDRPGPGYADRMVGRTRGRGEHR